MSNCLCTAAIVTAKSVIVLIENRSSHSSGFCLIGFGYGPFLLLFGSVWVNRIFGKDLIFLGPDQI